MVWRWSAAAILVGCLVVSWTSGAQDAMMSWYPLQAGDTWVYQKESRDGDMAHPKVELWTTEETIVGSVAVPEVGGSLITKRTRVLDHSVPPDFIPQNDSTRHELAESHLLVRGNCVYLLDGIDAQGSACDPNVVNGPCLRPLDEQGRIRPQYRDDLLRGKIPADFCFPMAVGSTWGRIAVTSPANEWVWRVEGLNGDPFGPAGQRTFHLWTHLASGTKMDRWFEEGAGVVQEVTEHHGTYGEQRRTLSRTTLRGKTRSYRLTPAQTVPLSDSDCDGAGWRHYVRADGAAFHTMSECAAYSSGRR
jgi:hypothetical protein